MESINQDYDTAIELASTRQLSPPSSPDISNKVGTSQSNPRIGDEYQVEAPSMIKESERHQRPMNPAVSELVNDSSHCFALGLPIPLTWVKNEAKDKGNAGWGFIGDNDGTNSVTVPAAPANVKKNGIPDNGKELRPTTSQSVMAVGQNHNSGSHLMVPGTLSDSWSDADVKSFLVGLFIFGKNFVQIKRYLENKTMGEILSFYYGKFYKSDEYRKWSGCKKLKGRKCVTGQKLFSGRRQQELLSRLIPQVPEEFQDTLRQVSKSYEEGRTSLEEYISSLKSTAGLGVLVEAVGIGKGNEDLTNLPVEPRKKSQVSEPTSNAWSSLGPNDILKFLTGESRLSKTKSNELFWAAIWPRLLARGWHSENLKNQVSTSTKKNLVFLVPGVLKFSKEKLVKGDHYFDSVSDILSKVIAEPNLLELEVEEAKGGGCNDEQAEKGSSEESQPDSHQHCCLKPQTDTKDHMKCAAVATASVHGRKSSDLKEMKSLHGNSVCKTEVNCADMTYKMGNKHINKTNKKKKVDSINRKLRKFTVVDTSSLGKLSKVREWKFPLVDVEDPSKSGIARQSDRSSLVEISPSETEAVKIYCKKNSSNADCQKGKHNRNVTGQKEVKVNPDSDANKMTANGGNQNACVSDGNQLKRTIKHQFSRRARSGYSNLAAPPIKRRRLTACAKAETIRILDNSARGLGSESLSLGLSHLSCFLDANKKAGDTVGHKQDVISSSFSAEGSAELNKERSILNRVCLDKGISCDKVGKCESQPSIIFNAPEVAVKSEDGEMVEENGQGLKPDDTIQRRQSTRNRPLTVRALESLASEFLHEQRKQKRRDTLTLKDPLSTCRKARTGA